MSSTTESSIGLSIVIIVLEGRDKLIRCLSALAGQASSDEVEIIVPYGESHKGLSSVTDLFPGVRFIQTDRNHTYAEFRSLGVRASRGRLVATTEDHCIPDSDWIARIFRGQEMPYAALGGAVEKAEPDSALNWSLYLADYVRYANPLTEGSTESLTDCNVSYKRAKLDDVRSVWAVEFHEPEVHAALRAGGETLWLDPNLIVRQQRSVEMSHAVRDRYAFGRLLGARRVMGAAWSLRLRYALFSVVIPLLLTVRIAQQVLRRRRFLGPFVRALPIVLLLNTVWALGEFVGYVTATADPSLSPEI